jgi:cell division protein FtsL
MWWILFTAADLYIGIIVLKAMAPSLPEPKQKRLAIVEKVLWASIAVLAVAFAVKVWH